jgi:ferric-dicitrate binding protein FerR (iron transport regulator)
VGLDDAIADLESRLEAERRAAAQNRDAVDEACRRFAELAAEKGIPFTTPDESNSRPFWRIRQNGASDVLVFGDGTWVLASNAQRGDPIARKLEAEMAVIIVSGLIL